MTSDTPEIQPSLEAAREDWEELLKAIRTLVEIGYDHGEPDDSGEPSEGRYAAATVDAYLLDEVAQGRPFGLRRADVRTLSMAEPMAVTFPGGERFEGTMLVGVKPDKLRSLATLIETLLPREERQEHLRGEAP